MSNNTPYRCVWCLVIILLTHVAVQSGMAANKTSGRATIYANSFSGKKTANGAIYNPKKMTAASNKLPLGSKVLVTNKQSGKKAEVVINDRMSPHVPAVIDLSKGAADKLGVKGRGQVQAVVVKKPRN